MSLFFSGSHWWVLEPLDNGHKTRLVHGAEIMGLALPFIQPTMHATRAGYHKFNKALRDEVMARKQQKTQQQEDGAAAAAKAASAAAGKPVVTVMDAAVAEEAKSSA